MSGCLDAGRPGCRGRLCRSAHGLLRRLPTVRYPAGDNGLPNRDAQPERGWVCGLVSYRSAPDSGSLDIPGVTGGRRTMQLIVASGSLEPQILSGDRITANGMKFQVCSVSRTDFLTAELIPTEEVG